MVNMYNVLAFFVKSRVYAFYLDSTSIIRLLFNTRKIVLLQMKCNTSIDIAYFRC